MCSALGHREQAGNRADRTSTKPIICHVHRAYLCQALYLQHAHSFAKTLKSSNYQYPHFLEGETEAQSS